MAQAQWLKIAGDFPPTLNKEDDPTTLKVNETPAAYGIDINKPTLLKAGAVPTGTTALATTYTIDADTYNWWYNRLWRISGTQVIFGAPEYTATYYEQDIGHIDLPQGTGDLVAIRPLGQTALIAFKADCFFIINNADRDDANFSVTYYNQRIGLDDATHLVELDGVVYVSNTTGLWSIAYNGDVNEITAPVKNNVAPFASQVLTANYAKKWIIGGTTCAYDTLSKRLFDYSTDGFLYTSPTLTMRRKGSENTPFVVDAIALEVVHDDTTGKQITYQTKVNDRDWNTEVVVDLIPEDGTLTRHLIHFDSQRNGRTFAVRFTAMSAGVAIKNIFASLDDANRMEAYAE